MSIPLVEGFVVSVLANLNTSSGEDCLVIAPGRLAYEEGAWSELVEELGNDTESTSTREGLE